MSKDKKTPPGDKVKGFNLLKRAEIFFLTSMLTLPFIANDAIQQRLNQLQQNQTAIETSDFNGKEETLDKIFQIPDMDDHYDYYNTQIRKIINKSREEKGIEGIGNEEPIYSSYLNDSTFYETIKLTPDKIETHFGRTAAKAGYSDRTPYIDIYRGFGTFSSLNATNVESLKLFFNTTENKKVNYLYIYDISSGKEVKELISLLLRKQIQVTELEIRVNKEKVIDGKYIEFLSNLPGLRSLFIDNNRIVPVHAQNLGKYNVDLRSVEFLNRVDFESVLSFDSKEIKDLEMRGIKIIFYNHNLINIDKKFESLQDVLDRYVRFLNSKYDFDKLNNTEKAEKIIEAINELYRYSEEVNAEKDKSKKEKLWLKYYEDGAFAPLVDVLKYGIDETTGERNAICGNYAALCVALCERILGEGSAYLVNDIISQHAYCLINLNGDGKFFILDPTFSDEDNTIYWAGIDKNHTEDDLRKYFEMIMETRRNYLLDTERESAKSIRKELREWSRQRIMEEIKSNNNPNARKREGLIYRLRLHTKKEIRPLRKRDDVILQKNNNVMEK